MFVRDGGMMKTLYQKSELCFSLAWIIAYCVLMSAGDGLSAEVGVSNAVSLPIAAVLSAVLFAFLKRNKLLGKYGFCKPAVSASQMLFYIPLALLLTANVWFGIVSCILLVLISGVYAVYLALTLRKAEKEQAVNIKETI